MSQRGHSGPAPSAISTRQLSHTKPYRSAHQDLRHTIRALWRDRGFTQRHTAHARPVPGRQRRYLRPVVQAVILQPPTIPPNPEQELVTIEDAIRIGATKADNSVPDSTADDLGVRGSGAVSHRAVNGRGDGGEPERLTRQPATPSFSGSCGCDPPWPALHDADGEVGRHRKGTARLRAVAAAVRRADSAVGQTLRSTAWSSPWSASCRAATASSRRGPAGRHASRQPADGRRRARWRCWPAGAGPVPRQASSGLTPSMPATSNACPTTRNCW